MSSLTNLAIIYNILGVLYLALAVVSIVRVIISCRLLKLSKHEQEDNDE